MAAITIPLMSQRLLFCNPRVQWSSGAESCGRSRWNRALPARFDFVLPEARGTTVLLVHEMVLHNRGRGPV